MANDELCHGALKEGERISLLHRGQIAAMILRTGDRGVGRLAREIHAVGERETDVGSSDSQPLDQRARDPRRQMRLRDDLVSREVVDERAVRADREAAVADLVGDPV